MLAKYFQHKSEWEKKAYPYREMVPKPLWYGYRVIRVGCVASAFAAFWMGGTWLSWIVLPLFIFVFKMFQKRKNRSQTSPRPPAPHHFADPELVSRSLSLLAFSFRIFHGYMAWLRLVKVEAKLRKKTEKRDPVVIVANHTTLVDMTAILANYPKVICVTKSAYARNFFVRRLLQTCGFILVGHDRASQLNMFAEATERLRQGFDLLVFPEGTRSPSGGMFSFQRGAFEIACRMHVDIQPFALTCEPSALTKKRPFWTHPDKMALLTIAPVSRVHPEDFNYNSKKMRDFIELMYRQHFGFHVEEAPKTG